MAVSGVKGTGIGQVTLPEYGGPLALQGGLRAAEPRYLEQITGDVEDYTGGLVGAGLGLVDILGELLGKSTDERLMAGEPEEPVQTPNLGSFQAGSMTRERVDPSQSYQDEIMRIAESMRKDSLDTSTTTGGEDVRPSSDEDLGSMGPDGYTGIKDSDKKQTGGYDEVPEKDSTNIAEAGFSSGMKSYLDALSGEDTGVKSLDEYKKEFADATGLDISGKPDKSSALMAFGLALMQNKAGKGFNVGRMLSALGEAGEKAMPALEKAKAEARALRAKAGEYALGRTKEDQAKAMQRVGYYIVPKSQGLTGRIKAFTEDSRRANLNAFELEALYGSEGFRKNFDVIPASEYNDVYKELTKKPEYGDMYASSYENISLFNDAPDDLQIGVQRVNANYKGPNRPSRGYFNPGEYDVFAGRLNSMESDLNKTGEKLAEAYAIVNSGEVTTPKQVGDAITSFGRAFGIKFGEGATDRDKVLRIINVISAERAPEILGEAGKTISDADRERVNAIVGTLGLTEDPEKLKEALNDIYDTIVIGGYKDVEQGYATLNMYAGVAPKSRPTQLKKRKGTESTFDATVE